MQFPKAFILNLPHRKDRLDKLKDSFKGWNLNMRVLPGIKHAEGWKGCTLSHRKAVQTAKDEGLPWVLILEDDCVPEDPTPDRFNALLPILWEKRNKWDIFIGGPTFVSEEKVKVIQEEPPLVEVKGFAIHFILINGKIFDKILTDININSPPVIDVYYRDNYTLWATWPTIAVQAESVSNIGKEKVNYRHLFNNSAAKIKSVLNRKKTTSTKGGRRLKYKTRKVIRKRKQRGGATDKCLFVQLFGGLGNQLYMYAAALTVSKMTGLPVCISPQRDNKHTHTDYREFMNCIKVPYSPEVVQKIESADLIIKKRDDFHSGWSKDDILEGSSKYKKMPEDYYQNYKSMHTVIPEIKEMLNANVFNKYKDKYKINSETSAFMHVRRGDYLELNIVEPDEYFKNALKRMDTVNKITHIYILSNDLEWCKKQEPVWKTCTSKHIEYKDIPDELESLYFMSLCTGGAIIPSSSFSAWGTFLGADRNPESTIIYPKINAFKKGEPQNNVHEFPSRWIGL